MSVIFTTIIRIWESGNPIVLKKIYHISQVNWEYLDPPSQCSGNVFAGHRKQCTVYKEAINGGNRELARKRQNSARNLCLERIAQRPIH